VIFLREFVSASLAGDALRAQWERALLALLDLQTTYAWGSTQRRQKLQALAKSPDVVRAVQAAVVASANPPMDMLAVLSIDASDASLDALLPHFAHGTELERLQRLATHATRTPGMEALLSGTTNRLETRARQSPAVAFVQRVLGSTEPLSRLDFSLTITSVEAPGRNSGPTIQGRLAIDASDDEWWHLHLSRVDFSAGTFEVESTSFGAGGPSEDRLHLGHCALEDVPQWLSKARRTLNVHWAEPTVFRGSLRGKKRDVFSEWLFSPSR